MSYETPVTRTDLERKVFSKILFIILFLIIFIIISLSALSCKLNMNISYSCFYVKSESVTSKGKLMSVRWLAQMDGWFPERQGRSTSIAPIKALV